jgi:hypothetical protein
MTPADPTRCPLCGEPNACQPAAGRSKCWCFDTPVPPDVLARVPGDAQDASCACRRCAGDPDDRDGRRRRALRWVKR